MKFQDLTGKKFGMLTVEKQLADHYTSGGNKVHKWLCSCECGRDDNVICSTGDLNSGKRWRCTYCVRDDAAKRMVENNKKYNTYDLTGTYGIGYTSKGEEFWFDLEDYDLIKDFCIYKHHDYFEAKIPNKDKAVGLHKIIMSDIDNRYDIDHIKTERKFDNRKLNLRKVTRSQNRSNSVKRSNNKSGVTGVYWHSRDNVWVARLKFNNIYHQKYFDDFDEACNQRKQWENEYLKDYSYNNSQKLYEERTQER